MFDCSKLQIVRTIGVGTFGRVYLSKYNGKYYALKSVSASTVLSLRQMNNLNDERETLRKVFFCKYFVRLILSFRSASAYFMVMEYVAGGELFYWLRKHRSFRMRTARFYAAEIALALEYLFGHGLIYRDLKPENILLTEHGHIKLVDLGFARQLDTLAFTLCGTPEYMAPEKLRSDGYDQSSDIWSFGVLVYEMLTGEQPFMGQSTHHIYHRILTEQPVFTNVDLIATDLLVQLLEKNPKRRLTDMARIKRHPFFNNIFERIDEVEPPIVPKLDHDGDNKYFIRYDEENDSVGMSNKVRLYYSFN